MLREQIYVVKSQRQSKVLNGALVLVAEDQPFIALELAFAIEDEGGTVAGPAASVASAVALIRVRQVAGAILDFNLTDGDITPLVWLLSEAKIPMIVQSGLGCLPELSARFPDLAVYSKPNNAADLVEALAKIIAAQ